MATFSVSSSSGSQHNIPHNKCNNSPYIHLIVVIIIAIYTNSKLCKPCLCFSLKGNRLLSSAMTSVTMRHKHTATLSFLATLLLVTSGPLGVTADGECTQNIHTDYVLLRAASPARKIGAPIGDLDQKECFSLCCEKVVTGTMTRCIHGNI